MRAAGEGGGDGRTAAAEFNAERRSLFESQGVGGTVTLEPRSDRGSGWAPRARPEPRRWQPGDVLNERYSVVEVVGEGGMGLVYRVRDALHPARSVALKTLSPTFVDAPRAQLLEAEFRTMSELSHPNIARVHDFEHIAGTDEHCFTMELLDGRDLLTATEGEPLERVLDWFVEACRALQYLHSRGVIHADVKPHNVVVTDSGRVKVLDFGLSGVSGAGRLLGTPAYMAPELRTGRPADARADLYALGITLYQLVYRRVPFRGESLHHVFHQHAHAPLPFPEKGADGALDIGHGLRSLLVRLCAKRPEDRLAGADEVIEVLADATGRAYSSETLSTRRSYVSRARLVGRDADEQALLAYCLAGSPSQGGSAPVAGDVVLACVSGVSGVGKSRLVAEVKRRLQLSGTPFVESSCYDGSFGELEPLREWVEALRRLGRARGAEELELRYEFTLQVFTMAAAPARTSAAQEDTLRMAALRALADYVLDLSEILGLVLSMGDLQWGRTSTTDFLKILCERQVARRDAGRAPRLSVIVSYRDDEPSGPLEDLLAAVAPERRLHVALSPLAPALTAELVASMLGTTHVPEAFSDRVAAETGGNPFFIEEVMRALIERGDVYLSAGEWAARTDVAHIELPTTIASVLARRLASVDPRERDALDWLSVYAQPMPLALLAEVAGVEPDVASAIVQRLVERHMVMTSSGVARVQTAHDKLREYLYASMTPATRAERHAAVAELLDRVARGDAEYVIERAHHYWHADDDERSRAWAERAATLAERTFATDVALDNYDRLRILAERRGDEDARRRATDKVLELCAGTGQYARLLSLSELELAQRRDAVDRARFLQLQGEALGCQGKLREAVEKVRAGAALLGVPVPSSKNARRLFLGAHYARHLATINLRRHDVDRGERLAPGERQRLEILGMCFLLMAVYSFMDGDDEGYLLVFAGINLALPLGRAEVLTKLLANGAFVNHTLGRFRESERTIRLAQRVAATEPERAIVLTIGTLARQLTQRPIFPEQLPIHAYEADIVHAIEVLSTRSRVMHANVARMVATLIVSKYALRYERHPEVARWAEAMRGTLHYGFVEGNVAVMAQVDGDRRRSEKAYALTLAARMPDMYRAWIAGDLAYVCAVTGDTERALRSVESVQTIIRRMELRSESTLWAPAMTIAAILVLEARGARPAWLRPCLEELVAALDRVRHRPGNMRMFHESGRVALGRSHVAALREAARRSHETWSRDKGLFGHMDGCIVAALALRGATRPEEARAAASWTDEALALLADRFPESYAGHVRELLGGKLGGE